MPNQRAPIVISRHNDRSRQTNKARFATILAPIRVVIAEDRAAQVIVAGITTAQSFNRKAEVNGLIAIRIDAGQIAEIAAFIITTQRFGVQFEGDGPAGNNTERSQPITVVILIAVVVGIGRTRPIAIAAEIANQLPATAKVGRNNDHDVIRVGTGGRR